MRRVHIAAWRCGGVGLAAVRGARALACSAFSAFGPNPGEMDGFSFLNKHSKRSKSRPALEGNDIIFYAIAGAV
jgi:hypothetical protein